MQVSDEPALARNTNVAAKLTVSGHRSQAALDGGEVRRGEVLGEDDRLDCQGPWPAALGEMDEQFDVEGLVEGRHLPDGRAERGGVEGLEAGLGVEHVGQGWDEQGPDEM